MKTPTPILASILLFVAVACTLAGAALPPPEVVTQTGLAYYEASALTQADEYQTNHCKLDIRYPANRKGFATVVWFHGGGLTGGKRRFPDLRDPDIAVVTVSYRLSPKVALPGFFEDAAAATAWVLRHIEGYGGDPAKVFVSGHSAGGYLAAMIGMDPRWLAPHGLSHQQLAGLIPVSAQVTTHFHVKKLRGDTGPELRPLIDEFAPLYHASDRLPPICLITGDRLIEYKSRVEENQLLAVTLRNLGHSRVECHEMGGLDHVGIAQGGMILVRQFVKRTVEAASAPGPAAPRN
jgi:acetyl esterase/lipase